MLLYSALCYHCGTLYCCKLCCQFWYTALYCRKLCCQFWYTALYCCKLCCQFWYTALYCYKLCCQFWCTALYCYKLCCQFWCTALYCCKILSLWYIALLCEYSAVHWQYSALLSITPIKYLLMSRYKCNIDPMTSVTCSHWRASMPWCSSLQRARGLGSGAGWSLSSWTHSTDALNALLYASILTWTITTIIQSIYIIQRTEPSMGLDGQIIQLNLHSVNWPLYFVFSHISVFRSPN